VNELFVRLRKKPLLAFELLAATFFINLLGFASPVFVMLILGVYINAGFDGTLITLSIGMLIAMLIKLAFQQVRMLQAGELGSGRDRRLSDTVFEVISRARTSFLERIPGARKSEAASHAQAVQNAYGAINVTAMLDAPFSLFFIAATYWLSPALALVGLMGMGISVAAGFFSMKFSREHAGNLQSVSTANRGLLSSAMYGADTVRVFRGKDFLGRKWDEQTNKMSGLRKILARLKGRSMSLTLANMTFIRVIVYAVGAKQCVMGELSFAALIVANILVSRALRQVSGFLNAMLQFSRAETAFTELKEFFKIPLEAESGTAMRAYSGGLEFKDLGFGYPGGTGPLFESLSLSLRPGNVLVAHGYNGAGKTTLARMVAGLIEPLRGEILADGVNLRQIAPGWWRKQIIYMPQEPTFLNGTILENITLSNPDINREMLGRIIHTCGLERFLDNLEHGLDTRITDAGRNFPLGFRRRLALARALVTNGALAILDEPTEGLDAEGAHAVYAIIREMAAVGKTVIAFSHDVNILRGANVTLDLGVKPTPKITVAPPKGGPGGDMKHAGKSRIQ